MLVSLTTTIFFHKQRNSRNHNTGGKTVTQRTRRTLSSEYHSQPNYSGWLSFCLVSTNKTSSSPRLSFNTTPLKSSAPNLEFAEKLNFWMVSTNKTILSPSNFQPSQKKYAEKFDSISFPQAYLFLCSVPKLFQYLLPYCVASE